MVCSRLGSSSHPGYWQVRPSVAPQSRLKHRPPSRVGPLILDEDEECPAALLRLERHGRCPIAAHGRRPSTDAVVHRGRAHGPVYDLPLKEDDDPSRTEDSLKGLDFLGHSPETLRAPTGLVLGPAGPFGDVGTATDPIDEPLDRLNREVNRGRRGCRPIQHSTVGIGAGRPK
jgi:hypothetical protein